MLIAVLYMLYMAVSWAGGWLLDLCLWATYSNAIYGNYAGSRTRGIADRCSRRPCWRRGGAVPAICGPVDRARRGTGKSTG